MRSNQSCCKITIFDVLIWDQFFDLDLILILDHFLEAWSWSDLLQNWSKLTRSNLSYTLGQIGRKFRCAAGKSMLFLSHHHLRHQAAGLGRRARAQHPAPRLQHLPRHELSSGKGGFSLLPNRAPSGLQDCRLQLQMFLCNWTVGGLAYRDHVQN